MSGGPSQLLDDFALPVGTEASDFASTCLPLQQPSEPISYLRPGQAGASPGKMTPKKELAQLASALKKAGSSSSRRDRPPPAAERRGGGTCQAGRAWRRQCQEADDRGQPAPRRLDRQALSRPRRSLRPDPGGHARRAARSRSSTGGGATSSRPTPTGGSAKRPSARLRTRRRRSASRLRSSSADRSLARTGANARAYARPRAEPGGVRRGDRPAARTRPPSAWLR